MSHTLPKRDAWAKRLEQRRSWEGAPEAVTHDALFLQEKSGNGAEQVCSKICGHLAVKKVNRGDTMQPSEREASANRASESEAMPVRKQVLQLKNTSCIRNNWSEG